MKHQVKGGLLLDVVIGESATVLELLASEDKTLLIRRNAFLILDLLLDLLDRIRALNLEGDGLASQSLHKDLHTTTKAENQVEGGFLLDVVVSQSAAIFQSDGLSSQGLDENLHSTTETENQLKGGLLLD